MLVYSDGSTWRSSHVPNRTSDNMFGTSGGYVRNIGRPLVLVDRGGGCWSSPAATTS